MHIYTFWDHDAIVKQLSKKRTGFLCQRPISGTAIESTQGICKDLAGLHLVRHVHSNIHAFFNIVRTIANSGALVLRHNRGRKGSWMLHAFILYSSVGPRSFCMTLWIIAGLWRTDPKRESGLEVRASAYRARHHDWSVWRDVLKVDAICDNCSTTERCQRMGSLHLCKLVEARREGMPTSCNGGRARAPDWRHQIVQAFDQVGHTNHNEHSGGCKDIDVVVPVWLLGNCQSWHCAVVSTTKLQAV